MNRFAQVVLILLFGAIATAQRGATKPLEIWVVDVEGGKAALYVTPTGQTAIIDTGFPGARDLDRIMAAIADAGVKQIDYLISTHYHVDHIGNLVELAKRIPVGTFVDHGPTVEGPDVPQVPPGADGIPVTKPREQIEGFQAAYAELYGKAKHLVVKPGDRLPITGRRVADRDGSRQGAEDAGAARRRQAEPVLRELHADGGHRRAGRSRRRAVGGQRRSSWASSARLDFGDMWRTKELELMCPNNPIGTVDLLFASSHGAIASGSLPFVHGLQPRVALMQNGTRKGGAPDPMKTILVVARVSRTLWQMHWSYNAARAEHAGAVHREHRGCGDDCRRVDGAAARRWSLALPHAAALLRRNRRLRHLLRPRRPLRLPLRADLPRPPRRPPEEAEATPPVTRRRTG